MTKAVDDSNFEATNTLNHEDLVPFTSKDVDLCEDSIIDTLLSSAEGYTFIFRGNKYWKLTDKTVAFGDSKIISQGWPGLPGNIDAIFTYKKGKTYFFKRSKCCRYKGRKIDYEYVKKISEGFPGILNDITQLWSGATRFTNSGGLFHHRSLLLNLHFLNQSLIGKGFLVI